jgi:hypothetical protein
MVKLRELGHTWEFGLDQYPDLAGRVEILGCGKISALLGLGADVACTLQNGRWQGW